MVHGPRTQDDVCHSLLRRHRLEVPGNGSVFLGLACHRSNRELSAVREDGNVVTHVPVWRGRLARFEHFFPNGDMLIFFYEPNARIGEWWNVAEISHIFFFRIPTLHRYFSILRSPISSYYYTPAICARAWTSTQCLAWPPPLLRVP